MRIGFSGIDWAAQWLELLAEFGLTGADYVLKRPSVGLNKFVETLCRYDDLLNAPRVILTLPPINLSVVQALGFTLHSFRHLYPIASRQLRQALTDTNELGHWAPGSTMAVSYDTAYNVRELVNKAGTCARLGSFPNHCQEPLARLLVPTSGCLAAKGNAGKRPWSQQRYQTHWS